LSAGYGEGLLGQKATRHLKRSRATSTIDPQMECSNQTDVSSRFALGNPLLFLAFLTEVINNALASKQQQTHRYFRNYI